MPFIEALGVEVSDETLENIRLLTTSPAWTDYYVPMLLASRKQTVYELLNPSWERKGAKPDDYLRGRVEVLDQVLTMGDWVIEEDQIQKARFEAELQQGAQYQERADLGHAGPMLSEN